MPHTRFDGRLDLHVACLLVADRHDDLANRSVTTGDVADVVLELVDLLDVEADDLEDLDEFEDAIEEAMDDLVDEECMNRRKYGSVVRYKSSDGTDAAIGRLRKYLASRPRRLHALDDLTNEITELVLARHGEDVDVSAAS